MSIAFLNELIATITERGRSLIGRKRGTPAAAQDLPGMCDALYSGLGEASGAALAGDIFAAYGALSHEERVAFFRDLLERYGPDRARVRALVVKLAADPDDNDAAALLHQASEPRRQELIRRLNMAPGGTAAIVAMRADLLGAIGDHPELAVLDADFSHLLSSWFNTGFMVLRRIDWSTPAVILEKIIHHEAVHEITDWDDLRRRIDPGDRRLYAFFHPVLVDEPLIFVEVALVTEVPSAIAPILEDGREEIPANDATVAAFYSLSTCQKGLGGISFGSFLIKRVAEELGRELPNLKSFATLSPVPNFKTWLDAELAKQTSPVINDEWRADLTLHEAPGWFLDTALADRLRDILVPLLAYYLLAMKDAYGKPFDPVARLHLRNGARLERINWLADQSDKGLAQSVGMMVNYLYELKDIVKNHELYANEDHLVTAPAVRAKLEKIPKGAQAVA